MEIYLLNIPQGKDSNANFSIDHPLFSTYMVNGHKYVISQRKTNSTDKKDINILQYNINFTIYYIHNRT